MNKEETRGQLNAPQLKHTHRSRCNKGALEESIRKDNLPCPAMIFDYVTPSYLDIQFNPRGNKK